MATKILIIDDEAPILELYSRWLNAWGYDVDTALGGSAAMHLIDDDEYALVISDAKMPVVSGLDVRKRLLNKAPKTPFILITGFSKDDLEIKEIMTMPIDKYLEKPVDFANLKKEIAQLISHH